MKKTCLRYSLIQAGAVLLFLPCFSIAEQSLADAARKEAERRNRIERLGIEEILIEGNGEAYAGEGNVSVSAPSAAAPVKRSPEPSPSPKTGSLSRYRKTLQKMDRDITREEANLRRLQDRLEKLRRESYGIGDLSKRRRNEESRDRIREQIEAAETELDLMREERRDVYDSGRKEGFLPGELDGQGIIP